jgi:hypothetical protein
VRSTAVATVQIKLVMATAGMAAERRKENVDISTPVQLGRTKRVPVRFGNDNPKQPPPVH